MRTGVVLVLVTALLASSPRAAAAQSSSAAQSPQSTARPASSATRVNLTSPVVVPSDYVIGPEDVLGVLFWREADISGDVVVRPDGMITLPLLGDVKVSGMTPDALREQIRVASSKFLTDPNVTVVVKQINSRKVFITGNVMMPDSYSLAGPRTVMQLIAQAGGLTEYADQENITILRQDANGQTRALKLNYKDVSKGRRLEQNILLQPGDTVIVN